tara:strand:- start:24245 stop:24688 length:444 start_codon:yes stop_codon:yes gene_type:complete
MNIVDPSILFVTVTFTPQAVTSLLEPTVQAGKKAYTYKTRVTTAPGDYCVVLVSGTPQIVQVLSTSKRNFSLKPTEELKWLVATLDKQAFFDYNNRVEREARLTAEMEELKDIARARAATKAFLAAFEGEPDLLARLETVVRERQEL